jgi:large subunit ribosomal protein L21
MANYAIIKTGGKQYRADPGAVLTVEKLPAPVGAVVEFDQVLFVRNGDDISVGAPKVEGATVRGTIVEQDRDKKILIHKHKKRKKYRKTQGHRQWITRVRVDEIVA